MIQNMKKTNIFVIIVVIVIIIFTIFLVLQFNKKENTDDVFNILNVTNNSNNIDNHISILYKNDTLNENIIDNKNNESLVSYYGYTFLSRNIDNIESKKNVIKKYSELQEFCDKYNKYGYDGYGNRGAGTLDPLLTRYDESFFDNKSLAIEYVELRSGSDTVEFESAIKEGSSVRINYTINRPSIRTMDMSGNLVIVEVDKEITDIV